MLAHLVLINPFHQRDLILNPNGMVVSQTATHEKDSRLL